MRTICLRHLCHILFVDSVASVCDIAPIVDPQPPPRKDAVKKEGVGGEFCGEPQYRASVRGTTNKVKGGGGLGFESRGLRHFDWSGLFQR